MKELARLAPAQTLILLNGSDSLQRDLLKYTLMDLLLKKILKISKKQFRASKHDPAQELTYIVAGKNFAGYKYASYEEIFLRPFLKSKNISILFRHVVKMGYENSGGNSSLQKMIYTSYELEGCVKKNLIHKIYGGFGLTAKGQELRSKVKEELDYFNEYIPTVITTDKQKAIEALRYIKGNIFLLTAVDFQLLKEIDKELADLDRKEDNSDSGCYGTGCTGCSTAWDVFDTFTTHHSHGSSDSDSSSSWFGSDSDSGSGCSGCSSSGCSGCGGD